MTVSEAQKQLPNFPETLKDEPAVITENGNPALIVFAIENFLSLLESSEALAKTELFVDLGKLVQPGVEQASDDDILE